MTVARQVIGISAAHRADQQLIAHRAAIDEEILPERIGARQCGQPGKAGDAHAFAFGIDGNGVGAKIGTEHVAKPRERIVIGGGGPGDRRTLFAGEREGDIGPAHGKTAHHFAHRFGFAAVGFEKFQARGRGVKQIAHFYCGALRQRGRLDVGFVAGIDGERPGMRLAGVPRGDDQPRHRADRGQSLAAKAERLNRQQIVAVELGGGVAVDAEIEIGARHAGAVVGDADEAAAAAVGQHVDALGAGVERVLDQFLDHARRALDHLAGGDAIDGGFGQLADGHESGLIRGCLDCSGGGRRGRGSGFFCPRYPFTLPRRAICPMELLAPLSIL